MFLSPFYFVVTVAVLSLVCLMYWKLERGRRAMRITGWLGLVALQIVAVCMVVRLALLRLELPGAVAPLGVETPWYYHFTVVIGALIPITILLSSAIGCFRKAKAEVTRNA